MHRSSSSLLPIMNQIKTPNPPEPDPGSSLGGRSSICNSDVGPSATVVEAAVARELYTPNTKGRGCGNDDKSIINNDDEGDSILQWVEETSEDEIVTKMERWKMEMQKPMHGGGKGVQVAAGEGARHKHKNTHFSVLFKTTMSIINYLHYKHKTQLVTRFLSPLVRACCHCVRRMWLFLRYIIDAGDVVFVVVVSSDCVSSLHYYPTYTFSL